MKVAVIGSRGLIVYDLERYPPKDVTPFILYAQHTCAPLIDCGKCCMILK